MKKDVLLHFSSCSAPRVQAAFSKFSSSASSTQKPQSSAVTVPPPNRATWTPPAQTALPTPDVPNVPRTHGANERAGSDRQSFDDPTGMNLIDSTEAGFWS